MAEKKKSRAATTKEDKPAFEDALKELQTLVDAMEKGDISLEESLQAFERGVELTRHCQTALFNAEQKIQQLNADGEIQDLVLPQESDSD
jgi:exodeoxyribonuclease VII small subunit